METFQVRLDLHIRYQKILLYSVPHQHFNSLTYDVSDIVDIHISLARVRQVYTYYYISTHLAGKSRRVIISETAVYKHHSVQSDGSEDSRYGHSRAHGIIHLAAMPYLRLA